MVLLMVVLGAFPADAVLVEAESFEVEAGWVRTPCRAERAPGGLSGGMALNANEPGSIALKRIELPDGEWTVWARVYDWGGAPGHYGMDLSVNGEAVQLAGTEPVISTYVWERWGAVAGGELELTLTRPDGFNSALDCLLFVRDPAYTPVSGPELELISAETTGDFPEEAAQLEVSLRLGEDFHANEAVVMLTRARGAGGRVWSKDLSLPEHARQWQPGETVSLPPVTLPRMPYLWPAEYALKLGVAGTTWAQGIEIKRFTKSQVNMPEPCRAEILPYRGAPTVHINGEPEFAYAFLMAAGDRDKAYRQMAGIGVRFFTMGAPMGITPDGFDPGPCDAPFLKVLEHQPDALMFPRVGVTAPSWWLEAHPDERVVFDDGSKGPQSMFSKPWLEDACHWVEAYSRYIRGAPYADHVIGIHICSGVTAEWQSWGLWSDQRGDFSPAAQRAWRAYLKDKYGTDAVLSRAWGRDAAIGTAAIPSRQRREAESAAPRDPAAFQDVIDFYDFYWRGTADAIGALAAAAKRGGGEDWLVGFFYGYAIQYGGKMQESQHLGMRRVMDCADIDFFCSPCMYSMRMPGGTSTFMSFTESIQRRGKFWWDEADNRTHLADNNVAPAANLFESLNVLEREFAHAVSRKSGIWWFDMQGGWYDHPEILELMRAMREFGETNPAAWEPKVEAAVFIDDKSAYRYPPEARFLHEAVTAFLAELPRLGVPYDTYLLSDLERVANRYRVFIFPLAVDLTENERAAIEGLKRERNALVFFGPAGAGLALPQGGVEIAENGVQNLLEIQPGEAPKTVDHEDWILGWAPNRMPLNALRALMHVAGAHVYHEQDDAFYAGNGIIALHAQQGGSKTVSLPERLHVRELFSAEPLSYHGQKLTFQLKAKETRVFAVHP